MLQAFEVVCAESHSTYGVSPGELNPSISVEADSKSKVLQTKLRNALSVSFLLFFQLSLASPKMRISYICPESLSSHASYPCDRMCQPSLTMPSNHSPPTIMSVQ